MGYFPPVNAEGMPLQGHMPSISDTHVDTRYGAYGVIDKDNLSVQWQVPSECNNMELQGMRLGIAGAVAGDKVALIEIGYYAPEWVQVSWYGKDLYFASPGPHVITDCSEVKSNPIPQGLYIKLTWAFADPDTSAQVKIAWWFKFWRPQS